MFQFQRIISATVFMGFSINAYAVVSPAIQGLQFRVESGFAVTASTGGGPAYWFNPQVFLEEVPKQLAPGLTGSDPSPQPSFYGAPSTLTWGDGSRLSVGGETGGHFEGFMPFDGTMVDTVSITFTNKENDGTKPALTYGLLADGVWLKLGAGEYHAPLYWEIFYADTPESSNCQTLGCADIAVVKPMGMTYSETLGMFTATTEIMGNKMTSLLQIEGLSVLDDEVCGFFGDRLGSGCVGLFLPENKDTTLQVKVGSVPVVATPLPPSVWMMGSAVAFLGVFSRRRQRPSR